MSYNLKNRLLRLAVVIAMRTTVTKRAQTVVPAEIRVRYGIKGGDLLESIDDGKSTKVVPVPRDAIESLRERLRARRRANRQALTATQRGL